MAGYKNLQNHRTNFSQINRKHSWVKGIHKIGVYIEGQCLFPGGVISKQIDDF